MFAPGKPAWISVTFFLVAAIPGLWIPVLSNILDQAGWSSWITAAFLVPPIASILSPLYLAAYADRKLPAQQLMGILLFLGAIFLYLFFDEIEKGQRPWLALTYLTINSLFTAPVWTLLTSISMEALKGREDRFGLYRVWGTIGWMAAGWFVSALAIDSSPLTGKIAFWLRLATAAICFLLPHTPPLAAPARTWQEKTGLSALGMLRHRDIGVFMLTTFLFSIPLAAYYMHTPMLLQAMEFKRVAASLTVGQMTEVVAMLAMGYAIRRFPSRIILLSAIACGTLRYALYALGATTGSPALVLLGVAFHGFCWTFFFEAGRLFLARRSAPEDRSQIQALMTLASGGVGSVVGTLAVGSIFFQLVQRQDTQPQWTLYWTILAGLCALCGLIFFIGCLRGGGLGQGLAPAPTPLPPVATPPQSSPKSA
jgi:MFS family permease